MDYMFMNVVVFLIVIQFEGGSFLPLKSSATDLLEIGSRSAHGNVGGLLGELAIKSGLVKLSSLGSLGGSGGTKELSKSSRSGLRGAIGTGGLRVASGNGGLGRSSGLSLLGGSLGMAALKGSSSTGGPCPCGPSDISCPSGIHALSKAGSNQGSRASGSIGGLSGARIIEEEFSKQAAIVLEMGRAGASTALRDRPKEGGSIPESSSGIGGIPDTGNKGGGLGSNPADGGCISSSGSIGSGIGEGTSRKGTTGCSNIQKGNTVQGVGRGGSSLPVDLRSWMRHLGDLSVPQDTGQVTTTSSIGSRPSTSQSTTIGTVSGPGSRSGLGGGGGLLGSRNSGYLSNKGGLGKPCSLGGLGGSGGTREVSGFSSSGLRGASGTSGLRGASSIGGLGRSSGLGVLGGSLGMAALKGSSSTGGPCPCGPSDISRPSGTSALSKAGSIQGSSESGSIGGLSGPGPTEEEFSKQAAIVLEMGRAGASTALRDGPKEGGSIPESSSGIGGTPVTGNEGGGLGTSPADGGCISSSGSIRSGIGEGTSRKGTTGCSNIQKGDRVQGVGRGGSSLPVDLRSWMRHLGDLSVPQDTGQVTTTSSIGSRPSTSQTTTIGTVSGPGSRSGLGGGGGLLGSKNSGYLSIKGGLGKPCSLGGLGGSGGTREVSGFSSSGLRGASGTSGLRGASSIGGLGRSSGLGVLGGSLGMAALKGSSSTGGPCPCGPSDISRPSGICALSKASSIQGSSESGNIGGLSGPRLTEEEFSKQAAIVLEMGRAGASTALRDGTNEGGSIPESSSGIGGIPDTGNEGGGLGRSPADGGCISSSGSIGSGIGEGTSRKGTTGCSNIQKGDRVQGVGRGGSSLPVDLRSWMSHLGDLSMPQDTGQVTTTSSIVSRPSTSQSTTTGTVSGPGSKSGLRGGGGLLGSKNSGYLSIKGGLGKPCSLGGLGGSGGTREVSGFSSSGLRGASGTSGLRGASGLGGLGRSSGLGVLGGSLGMAALKGSSSTGGPSPCGPSDISRPSGTSALSKAGSIQGSSESGNIGGLSGPGPTEEEFSKQAFPDLIPDMTLNLGMSSSTLRVLPFLNPGPVQLPTQEPLQVPPRMTLVVNPGGPFVLSPLPTISPVTGAAGHGPSNAEPGVFIFQVGPSNAEPGVFIFQVGPEAELVASAKQPAFQMQGRPNWGAAGSLPGGPRYPAPLISASSVKKTVVPTTASRVTQAVQGGFGPQGPPSVTQGQPIILPFNGGPQTMWVTGDNGVAPVQSRGPREKVGGSQSVYANFRLWQRYKPLAGLYFTQAPDTEAFACFLIPVLRSLARLKPTMTVEEGLGKAMQEWQHISKSEQEIYYGMATKFMEFETEEQMQAPKLQCGKGEKVLQSSTLPKPELQGTPPPAVGQQSACVTGNASPRALAPLPTKPKDQSLPRTQAPSEIPAEAVEEYIEIMNDLLKDHKIEESRKDLEEEEDRTWCNPNMLSYLDELCSQKDFVTKVEAIIDDRFLGHLLSSEPQLDISTLAKELEEVEGFSRSQLTDENLQALLDEQTGKAHLCHQKTHQDSIPEGISANIGAPTPTQASRPRASAATSTCVPTSSSGQTPRPVIQLATEASEPKPSQCPHPVLTTLGSRADHILEKDPLGILMPGPNESSEEEDLPSLAFLLDPCQSRQPRGLPLRPAPAPGPQKPRNSLRSCTPLRRAIHTSEPNTGPSKKRRRLGRGPNM